MSFIFWRHRQGQGGFSPTRSCFLSPWYTWVPGIVPRCETNLAQELHRLVDDCALTANRNMYFALVNGGPAAWFWSYIVVALGALCQAATFAEMASIQPIAGAQYYWTWNFSPPKCKRFLTWIQGWATWTGYVALLASCINGNTTLFEGMIQLSHPDFESGGWHTAVINLATIALCAGVNLFAFWLVPWFELLTGILNVCLFVIFIVVLWVMSPRNSPNIFFETNVSSGWDNYFVSANIGALSSIFLFCCKLTSESP